MLFSFDSLNGIFCLVGKSEGWNGNMSLFGKSEGIEFDLIPRLF